MPVILILVCVISLSVQNIFKKQFTVKSAHGHLIFSGMVTFFAFLFFLVTTSNPKFDLVILPFSLAFSVCYALATSTNQLAIKEGSLAITALALSYSLVIPTLHGLLFLHEEAGPLQYIGIALLLISLYLVRGSREKDDSAMFSLRWLLYVVIAFVANGFCSIIQNEQRRLFGGIYNNEFMVIALFFAALFLLIPGCITERTHIKETLRKGSLLSALCGVSNGLTNALVMASLSLIAASIFFPIISAGGLVCAFAASVLLYHEKFLPRQLVGLLCGVGALVFLNL